MVKLNNIVIFACNEGGHFAQLMALKELFSKYDSVILTDNKRANKGIPSLKDVKAIEFAMAFADKRDELTKDKDSLGCAKLVVLCELSVCLLEALQAVSCDMEEVSSESDYLYRK